MREEGIWGRGGGLKRGRIVGGRSGGAESGGRGDLEKGVGWTEEGEDCGRKEGGRESGGEVGIWRREGSEGREGVGGTKEVREREESGKESGG